MRQTKPRRKFRFQRQLMTLEEYGMWTYAREVSKESGIFYGGKHLDYDAFQCSRKTCNRVIRSLVKKGLFQIVKKTTRSAHGITEAAQYKPINIEPCPVSDMDEPIGHGETAKTMSETGINHVPNGHAPCPVSDTSIYPTSESFFDSAPVHQGERTRAGYANGSRAAGATGDEEKTDERGSQTNPHPNPTPTELDLELDSGSDPQTWTAYQGLAPGALPLGNPHAAAGAASGDSATAPSPCCTATPMHSEDRIVDDLERQRTKKRLSKEIAISDGKTWRELEPYERQEFHVMLAAEFEYLWNVAAESEDMPKFPSITAHQKTRLRGLLREYGRSKVISAWRLFTTRSQGFDGLNLPWTRFLGSNASPSDAEVHLHLRSAEREYETVASAFRDEGKAVDPDLIWKRLERQSADDIILDGYSISMVSSS